ncbi:MAG: DoxX family protein [Gammaproteobacteria bacterium]|nr:DoxX family protein [Gammaproteobacteria bacterium]NIR82783.1 DoxX family protein [Gammaproteobacteria bacterium]NIR89647.1 DoxX family protein [Gammaproteobacteria bacterium]NIU03943.1 DoxX family protein [Gammaproteobacteria bacterium]NIV51259.1 DoxX family membrane protein [Gammaproteobacteria bacterium]
MNLRTLHGRATPWYGIVVGVLLAVAELINRLWVANVFWKSGLTKIQSWNSTLFLFEYEYQVPLLSPTLAAYLGTSAELTLPVLLAFGLLGRLAAGGLFIFNFVAMTSYPALEAPGIHAHLVWGLMLLIPLFRGPGWISVDGAVHYFMTRRASVAATRGTSDGTGHAGI